MEGRFLIPEKSGKRAARRLRRAGLILGLLGINSAMTAAAAAGWIEPLFSGWFMGSASCYLGWKLGKE